MMNGIRRRIVYVPLITTHSFSLSRSRSLFKHFSEFFLWFKLVFVKHYEKKFIFNQLFFWSNIQN